MRAWLLIAILLLAFTAEAAEPVVPAPLEPWRAWVLKDHEHRACPLIAGRSGVQRDDYVCQWPGVLELAADANGVAIAQRWQLAAEGWVPLPGNAQHWPQQVTVGGPPAVVVDRQGPMLWLGAGTHELRARIDWDERPQALDVPEAIASIALSVDGRPVVPVQRTGKALTLGRAAGGAVEADSVELTVFRKFTDDVPGELATRVSIDASGQAREERFGPALPEGFVPVALSSTRWPARLDEDGMLRVQVQPGSNEVTLIARAVVPVERLVARVPEQWASQEVWSYQAMPSLRVTGVSGAVQVDPRQADVPGDWQALPAFALDDGGTLAIEVRSRGLDPAEANRLVLVREAWLDFSGGGWFARDRVSGTMQSGWRFDAAAPYALQRAGSGVDGDDESLLVTRGQGEGLTGAEWRTPQVDLRASLRIDAPAGALPVTGWQQVFDQVTTTLHLPYGHRLVAAPGSDRAAGSWLSRWTLLDAFLVAIIALLGARLFGLAGGVLTALYLLLAYQERGAPVWSLLVVLALGLVVRALPAGLRLARALGVLRVAALVVFAFIALPFAAQQVRMALYPQLEGRFGFGPGPAFAIPAMEQFQMAAAPASPPAEPLQYGNVDNERMSKADRMQVQDSRSLETIAVTGSRIRRADLMGKYSQNTVVQTGGGEPGWRLGNSYTLSWSGPVLPAQEVRLVVAPPWLVRSLRIVLAVLVGLLGWRLLRGVAWPRRGVGTATSASALLVSGLLVAVARAHAADYPPEHLLEQLRARLVEAPPCAPACANLARAEVSARGDEIRVVLEAHVAAPRVALPVPLDERAAPLRAAFVDGAASSSLARFGGKPWIALERGVHRVELVYAAVGDKVDLAFALLPRHVVYSGERWQASGLADGRLLADTLTIARARDADAVRPADGAQSFPAWVRVVRDISFDLDWSVGTQVQRVAPREGGFTVEVPILAGEHLGDARLRVRDGKVAISLPGNAREMAWHSTLDKADTLSLTAPPLGERAEVWQFAVSPTWHVEFSGVPESAMPVTDAADYRRFEFHPLPGETLTLKIRRPEPAAGATRAIDKVDLASEFGRRASTHTLRIQVRASQGGDQVIDLPAGFDVLAVSVDGAAVNARPIDQRLSVPVRPGAQTIEVRLRDTAEPGLRAHTPAISLGLPAANIDLRAQLPRDRWLLAAFGPAVGPAVLFWGELVVMIVVAVLLSRWRRSPLKLHQWLLLGLGFSTFSWIALAFVVAWLFAFEARRHGAAAKNWVFNLGQLGLVALTAIALGCLFASIHNGLLGEPDMVVSGYDSYARSLHWFADRSGDVLPVAGVVSLPLWVYNVVMLVWALWLAWAVVGWLRSGFKAWTEGGYWRRWSEPKPVETAEVPPPPPVPES